MSKVTGLKEGTYTFTEVQAPEGYNLLTTPITIEVKSNIAAVVADTTGATALEWQNNARFPFLRVTFSRHRCGKRP